MTSLHLHLHLPDPTATERAGAALAAALRGGMVLALHGDLGTGKTTLVRGVLRARARLDGPGQESDVQSG